MLLVSSFYYFVVGFERGGGGCGNLCQKTERAAGTVTICNMKTYYR